MYYLVLLGILGLGLVLIGRSLGRNFFFSHPLIFIALSVAILVIRIGAAVTLDHERSQRAGRQGRLSAIGAIVALALVAVRFLLVYAFSEPMPSHFFLGLFSWPNRTSKRHIFSASFLGGLGVLADFETPQHLTFTSPPGGHSTSQYPLSGGTHQTEDHPPRSHLDNRPAFDHVEVVVHRRRQPYLVRATQPAGKRSRRRTAFQD
jgi:hypothetical protein